jgi:hypothetical protein
MPKAVLAQHLTECFCGFCLCALPLDPKRGYCAECMKLHCWLRANLGQAHFLHDQCQEYFDSLVEELGE